MGTPVKSIAERWLKVVGGMFGTYRCKSTPAEFDSALNTLIIGIAKSVALDKKPIDKQLSDEAYVIEMKSRYSGLFMDRGNVDVLSKWYSYAYNSQKALVDARHQENWSNSMDHAKTFLFRMLTTLMIAGVVLGTSYLAKYWEIPLPMLRGL